MNASKETFLGNSSRSVHGGNAGIEVDDQPMQIVSGDRMPGRPWTAPALGRLLLELARDKATATSPSRWSAIASS
jgi:hypothetical protein